LITYKYKKILKKPFTFKKTGKKIIKLLIKNDIFMRKKGMNKPALEFLKDLQQQTLNLIEEQENKLETIDNENFKDDVSENVISKLNDILYEIETIMTDVEEGYYSNDREDFDDEDDDDFDEF